MKGNDCLGVLAVRLGLWPLPDFTVTSSKKCFILHLLDNHRCLTQLALTETFAISIAHPEHPAKHCVEQPAGLQLDF